MHSTHASAAASFSTTKKADLAVCRTSHVSTRIICGNNTHGQHDKLLCALALDTRDHPAHLIALRALLTGRQRRQCLAQPKLSLDTDPTSALQRLEADQPMARQREFAHLRFALRYRQRQQQP